MVFHYFILRKDAVKNAELSDFTLEISSRKFYELQLSLLITISVHKFSYDISIILKRVFEKQSKVCSSPFSTWSWTLKILLWLALYSRLTVASNLITSRKSIKFNVNSAV